MFHERSASILAALEAAEAAVARAQSTPSGQLRVAAGAEFGQLRVNGWITTYLARFPQVSVVTDYSNCISDIVHEGIDVAIRVGVLADSELSTRRLGEIPYALHARNEDAPRRSQTSRITRWCISAPMGHRAGNSPTVRSRAT